MADPLRHNCRIDLAEEILDFVANHPDAVGVRIQLKDLFELNQKDLENAHDVVRDFRNFVDNQKF
jgi:hypothetical protein